MEQSEMPLITVVIPVRNREEIVERTLMSVGAQTLRPLRVIVIDNGSTDNTLRIVERWIASKADDPQFEASVLSCAEGGVCEARNRGLAEVTSEYVAFFDSDDEMSADHLANVAATLRQFPDTDVAYFDIALIDSDGWSEQKRVTDRNLLRGHLLHSLLSTQRFVGRTSMVRDCGAWNPACARWNDLELGTRLLLGKPKVRKVAAAFPPVRVHQTAISITGTSYYDDELRCENTLDIIEPQLRGHKDAQRWLKARRAILAAHYAREGHHDAATRLMREVLTDGNLKEMLTYRAIYTAVRLTGHGGAFLAEMFLAADDDKNESEPRKKKLFSGSF